MKLIDLTGQRFGKLTVLSRAEDYISPKGRHVVRWLCKCDCGKIKKIHGTALRQGLSMSCGCTPSRKADDLSGNIYGKLTVLSRAKNKICGDGTQKVMWNCKCSCGNTVVVAGINLKTGATKSCGCNKNNKENLKKNTFNIFDDHAEIVVKGHNALIDLDDVEKCIGKYWQLTPYGYLRYRKVTDGHEKTLLLHRYIMDITDNNFVVDHINGNILDNRKSNLRICTQQQNAYNKRQRIGNYPGIDYLPYYKKWTARITCDGKAHKLGYFSTEEEAIQARIEAENKYFGEFGYYNSRIKNKEESA